MTEHILKTLSEYFRAVESKEKTYELRWNDRNFQVGDRLILSEIDQDNKETGRNLSAIITHILSGPIYGLAEGWAILSIRLGKRQGKANIGNRPESEMEAIAYGISLAMAELSARECYSYYSKTNWRMATGLPLANWRAAFSQWHIRDKKKAAPQESNAASEVDILLPRILRRAAALSDVRRDATFEDPAIGAVVSHYGWETLRKDFIYSGNNLRQLVGIYQRATGSLGCPRIACNQNASGEMRVPSIQSFRDMLNKKRDSTTK